MAKDFRQLPDTWDEAKLLLNDMLREILREMSFDNFEGEMGSIEAAAASGTCAG